MSIPSRKIGIVTGGGDCAGLNAVIASIVKAGIPLGYEFYGFERGWEGLLTPVMVRKLTLDSVRGISHLGGTILGTSNKGRFTSKIGEGEANQIPDAILQEAKDHLDELDIEGLIVMGGDGTLGSAMQLAQKGVNIIGVPKTIDNDLSSTDQTFGFSTAVQVATEAIDKVHTTAASHDRVIIVECMGRMAGWITLFAGLAGGAHAILLPEVPLSIENLVEFLRNRVKTGRHSSVVVIAEGVRMEDGLTGHKTAKNQEILLGGVSHHLIRRIEELYPDEFELRAVVLGHIQRGGSPSSEDRILAKRYGVAALLAYHEGRYGHMVSLRDGQMRTVAIKDAVTELKMVTEDVPEYQAAKNLGIFIG